MLKAQVGIGTDKPNASAVLELKSDNKGLLLPRVKLSDINNPAEGLLIYDSVKHCLSVCKNIEWKCLLVDDSSTKTSSTTKASVSTSKGQVGIGTENPNASAVLELKSDNKGLLLPRVNPSDIKNPAEGLLIYNSVKHCVSVCKNKE